MPASPSTLSARCRPRPQRRCERISEICSCICLLHILCLCVPAHPVASRPLGHASPGCSLTCLHHHNTNTKTLFAFRVALSCLPTPLCLRRPRSKQTLCPAVPQSMPNRSVLGHHCLSPCRRTPSCPTTVCSLTPSAMPSPRNAILCNAVSHSSMRDCLREMYVGRVALAYTALMRKTRRTRARSNTCCHLLSDRTSPKRHGSCACTRSKVEKGRARCARVCCRSVESQHGQICKQLMA